MAPARSPFNATSLDTSHLNGSRDAQAVLRNYFHAKAPHLATRLTITIHAMQILPAASLAAVLAWVQALSYPWCNAEEAVRNAADIGLLAPVVQLLS